MKQDSEKLPSQWIAELANNLEIKYKLKFNSAYFLDIWCQWWREDIVEASEFLQSINATETEIKAYLFQEGVDDYNTELVTEFLTIQG